MIVEDDQYMSNSSIFPQLPNLEDFPSSPSESVSESSLFLSDFSILLFNCQNSIQNTHESLTMTNFSLLALQEPWFNTHNLSFPQHEAWHRIMAYDYHATDWTNRPRVCLYLTKRIPTSQFCILPSSTDIILAIDIRDQHSDRVKLRVVSWYNPPNSMRGLLTLKHWLNNNLNRKTPTILVTDSNLHHQIWNPPDYARSDPLAKKFIHLCSNSGLKLISPKGTPTRFSSNTQPTAIDLVWASWNLTDKVKSCQVLTNTIASDHFPISTVLDFSIVPPPTTHISFKISDINHKLFHDRITTQCHLLPTEYSDEAMIDEAVETLSNIILEAAQDQGRKVTTRLNKHKSWWDKEKLTPILKNRNRARKWMIQSGLPEAQACYLEWQKFFKEQISQSKISHWKRFLASCSKNDTFKAFRYVKPCSTIEIAPLKKQDGLVATTKEEQASLLYYNTSVAHTEANLSDIPINPDHACRSAPYLFPTFETQELRRVINKLPNHKANGEDKISNELIKLALPAIEVELCKLFTACFRLGYFPAAWRKAITIIIRKAGKENYSDPNAYRPIALLSCLGKILEKVITSRITYWAESMKIIAPGHMGGRRYYSTDDALLILTTWIKERWRNGEVVSALSLDVKSAYPSVHRKRLWFMLHESRCPTYLQHLIHGFLSERSTNLRLQDYLSITFDCEDGLPQGSPLSVILYIIYNSPLLRMSSPSPEAKELSLGFIDNVIHLVASRSFEANIQNLHAHTNRSLEWADTHGAIFDRKKAQLIHFSHKRKVQDLPNLVFGDVILRPKQEIKWLGVWFDTKLLFNSHLSHVKKTGEFTISQLRRLSKCFSGLAPREIRKLVITVLCPRIFYGSIVWFTQKNFKKANKIISTLQNSTLNLILGAFRGSSIDLLYHDTYMTPFHLTIARKHYWFFLKRLAAPDSHPTQNFIKYELNKAPTTHKSPIQDMINIDFFKSLTTIKSETIFPHSFPPWTKLSNTIHNLETPKDELVEAIPQQVLEEEESGSIVIFTDGSVNDKGGGAAAVSKTANRSVSVRKTEWFSNHEMELLGVLLAVQLAKELIRKSPTPIPALAIFSDNQGVIQLIHDLPRATSGQHLVIQIQSLIKQLPTNLKTKLFWTPGHAGIELNEKADELAKQATVTQRQIFKLPASLGSLKKILKTLTNPKFFPFKPGPKPFITKPKAIAEALMNMEKGRSAAISQLRAGHSPLNDHLYKRQLTESPLCPICQKKETTDHFLLYCKRYRKYRNRFRHKLREEGIKVNWNNTVKLLDSPKAFFLLSNFILETQRFMYFHSYLQDVPPQNSTRQKGPRRRRSAEPT